MVSMELHEIEKDTCNLLIVGNKYEHVWAKAGTDKIWESECEKLLGIHIDRKLTFNYRVTNLCMKVGRKLPALIRLCKFYTLDR